jgi:hypothetical protein
MLPIITSFKSQHIPNFPTVNNQNSLIAFIFGLTTDELTSEMRIKRCLSMLVCQLFNNLDDAHSIEAVTTENVYHIYCQPNRCV